MKKIFTLLSCMLIALVGGLLAGCDFGGGGDGGGGGKRTLTKDMIYDNGAFSRTYELRDGPVTVYEHDINVMYNDKYICPDEYIAFSYEDNDKLGIAKVTISATDDNPYLEGSVTYEIRIYGKVPVSSLEEWREAMENEFVVGIYADSITIPAGETLETPEEFNVFLNEGATLTVDGTLINNGTIFLGDNEYRTGNIKINTDLIVNGTLINHDITDHTWWAMEIQYTGRLFNNGKVENERHIVLYGIIYGQEEEMDNVRICEYMTSTEIRRGSNRTRDRLAEKDVRGELMEKRVYSFTREALAREDFCCEPKVDLDYHFHHIVTYVNNTQVGTAKAVITVPPTNTSVYGSLEIEFEIAAID